MKLTIESLRGVWRAQLDSRSYMAETLEELLSEMAPDAPAAYVYHAGELLGGVLGAEVVEVQVEQVDWDELLTAMEQINESGPWQPTPEQRAYFEAMEDDGA